MIGQMVKTMLVLIVVSACLKGLIISYTDTLVKQADLF